MDATFCYLNTTTMGHRRTRMIMSMPFISDFGLTFTLGCLKVIQGSRGHAATVGLDGTHGSQICAARIQTSHQTKSLNDTNGGTPAIGCLYHRRQKGLDFAPRII